MPRGRSDVPLKRGRSRNAPGALTTRIVKFLDARAPRPYRAPEIAEALGESDRVLVVRAILRQLSDAGRIVRAARGLFHGTPKERGAGGLRARA
jgi:hypothetical protein